VKSCGLLEKILRRRLEGSFPHDVLLNGMNGPVGELIAADVLAQLFLELDLSLVLGKAGFILCEFLLEAFVKFQVLLRRLLRALLLQVEVSDVDHHLTLCVVAGIFLVADVGVVQLEDVSVILNELIDIQVVFVRLVSDVEQRAMEFLANELIR